MDLLLLLKSLVMGIVEGLTEFLPISSTGHLIIAGSILQFEQSIGSKAIAGTFEIFIQLGAILAVVVYFLKDLLSLLQRAPRDRNAQRLLIGIIIAFVPAGLVGLAINDLIDQYLFSPFTVGVALVLGGIVILVVENGVHGRTQPTTTLEGVSYKQSLWVGIAQVASLFPGVSRSAATIIGGLLVGLDRPTALRFSFYLSIPTLIIASLYKLYKDIGNIHANQIPAFGVGLVVSFIVALVVIKWFLGYVARHDFKAFAWYRLVLGALMIALYFPLPR